MKILKFTLRGKTAFFKKPDVNTFCYFTYGNIHKVALLGLFGAILGYGGYNKMKRDSVPSKKKEENQSIEYPEFYSRLKDIKISISPNNQNGFGKIFSKKIQFFNNSVGYASGEQGGNLIVKEQWLENPRWDIYIVIDSEETEKLAGYLLNQQCIYIPYLGKNDHPAVIEDVKCFDKVERSEKFQRIDSLCTKKNLTLTLDDEEEDDEVYIETFKYEEQLPVRLNGITNLYEMDTFILTNMKIHTYEGEVYSVDGKNIVFY